MKFQPGDRVLFTKSSWNPTPVGLVCRARISPRSGNPAYDVTWLEASGGWTDNIPEDDLALESRPVYPETGEIALLVRKIDEWTSAAYPSTPLMQDEMRSIRNSASRLLIEVRAALSGETEPVASTAEVFPR